jgi:ABC-2 type transport system ATP-binding protein
MNPAAPPAISVEGLTKDYLLSVRGYRVRAVDNLSLAVPAGQVFGLLGPNGSGKSTTIKAVLGLIEPSQGSTSIFGVPSAEVRSRLDVGYLPENPNFHRFLSGRELVTFYARICGVARARIRDRVDEVIEWVGLKDAAARRLSTYSKGMLQRIGLAQAVVHDPRLLILDEPTAGVDPVGSAEIGELILRLKAQGKTIVLSSHLLAQVEDLCDRIAILDRGRLVLEGGVEDLVTEKGRDALIVRGLAEPALGELRAWLAGRGAELVAVEKPRTTLDRVFREHVGARVSSPTTEDRGR